MKKLQKFCNLSSYLEQVDKEYLQAMEKMCVAHFLRPRQKGITLIVPDAAYRKKIINTTYSGEPEKAALMFKSLIIPECLPEPEDFGTEIVNLLHQRVGVEEKSDKFVVLEKGLKLEKDKDFVPHEGKNNIAVYKLAKGELPLDNPMVERRHKDDVKGGKSFLTSDKKELQTLLCKEFISQSLPAKENIYVKKVCLHLKCLADKGVPAETIKKYLGNDEFSDSYLLDMLCSKECAGCFSPILKTLQSKVDLSMLTREKYVEMRKAIVGDAPEVIGDPKRTQGLKTPIEIRTRIKKYYGDDKVTLGRDLFIVFCNINRDMWETELDKADIFNNWAYLCSNVYLCPSDILKNNDFNLEKDFTTFGYLLKSDVFMFEPRAEYKTSSLPIPSSLPSPLNFELFSLSCFINKRSYETKGGSIDKDVRSLLDGI